MTASEDSHQEATFGPLLEVCRAHGISRSVAYELAARGVLETFRIGSRRYVYLESMRTLPARLSAEREDD